MRRRLARPFGQTIGTARLLSLLMALAVLAMLYQRFKDPQTWVWLVRGDRNDVRAQVGVDAPNGKGLPVAEIIMPGPNETDADALAEFRTHVKVVEDRRPLQPHEMPAYWQLMAWSRSRSFVELEGKALRDLPYTQLWEQPELYRGQPIRMKLHVRRLLSYPAKENKLGIDQLYEAWGWTDESLSFPFVVVFPDRPPNLKIGTDVEADIVFVGYFLKWMGYQGFDKKKNSPLLIGRIKPAPAVARPQGAAWQNAFLVLVGAVFVLAALLWLGLGGWHNRRTTVAAQNAPDSLPDWFAKPTPPTDQIPEAKPQFPNPSAQ